METLEGNITFNSSLLDKGNSLDTGNVASISITQLLLQSLYHSESQWKSQALLMTLYVLEFSKLFLGPVLTKGLTMISQFFFSPVYSYMTRPRSRLTAGSWTEGSIMEEATIPVEQSVLSAEEDRKSSKGSIRDIAILQNRGYNRYRYVSRAFLKRNKLINDRNEEDSDKTEAEDEL
jgi:hypothetical protein